MKKQTFAVIIILWILIGLISCSKEATTSNRSATIPPAVASVTFAPAYAGGSVSVKFTATLAIPVPAEVVAVNLYRMPNLLLQTINKPESKTYTLYDHLVDVYPTYPQSIFYQFEIVMASGEKILAPKFQVY